MFRFSTEQKVFQIGKIKVGGQPGENPTLLLASLFQKGDKLVESRKERKFDKKGAKEAILIQERISKETGIPAIVSMVANSGDEMKAYIDFFVSVTDMPFAIDMWMLKPRLEATRYVAELGLMDRLLYNSITPWSTDLKSEVAEIKELGVKHAVMVVFDQEDQMPTGRIKSLKSLLKSIEGSGIENILVDTSVMNLPATAMCLQANYLVKEQFGLPAGCASANGTYMWKEPKEMWGREGFIGLDAATHAISSVLWSDFLFYGPISGAPWVFPAVASANAILGTLVFSETKELPKNDSYPLNKLFPDFTGQLSKIAHK
jgi:tetrahydromethanopterin S-methyltransferase subunit H